MSMTMERETGSPDDAVRAALRAELDPALAALHRFVDRRFAELSAELHASVEIADMGEARMAGELARIHDQIGQLVAAPAAATRNSGLELEAVVQATEAAANTILEAAEAIQDWVSRGIRDPESLAAVAGRVNAIFEACSFQDVTGQRIRRAIQHLQQVDSMLQGLATDGGAAIAPKSEAASEEPMWTEVQTSGPDLAQDEIDKLLA